MTRLATLFTGGFDEPPVVDPDAARRAADDILSDPAYAEPQQSVLDRALEWVLDRLGSVFGSGAGGGPGNLIGWLVVLALVAGAVWLLAKAVRVPSIRRREVDDELRYGTETHRDASVWSAEAARRAAAGDHRGALRCRHQALAARLVDRGVVEDVPGRTAGEYRDVARVRRPDVAAEMDTVTAAFDDVWYGSGAVDAGGYASFDRTCEQIEGVVAQPADEPARDEVPV